MGHPWMTRAAEWCRGLSGKHMLTEHVWLAPKETLAGEGGRCSAGGGLHPYKCLGLLKPEVARRLCALGLTVLLLLLALHRSLLLFWPPTSAASHSSPPLSFATCFSQPISLILQMVLLHGSSLVARALALLGARADNSAYVSHTVSAVGTLQGWYNEADGLWNTTGWWNSANLLTTLADFAALDGSDAARMDLDGVFANTYAAAQGSTQVAAKSFDSTGLVRSAYTRTAVAARADTFAGFINNYYDDEGWWALALIHAFDATGRAAYLTSAETIFADLRGGVTTDVCGGGIWWSKDRTYKNAIANELYLAAAASLANRAADTTARETYRSIAAAQWAWFRGSGLINSANTINDGFTITASGSCFNNGQTVWSYNQGVVLGGLVELHRAQAGADTSLLPTAVAIAKAGIKALSVDGILHESCEAGNNDCGSDGPTFKGVFLRNLYYLSKADLSSQDKDYFRTYIMQNANSIWTNDRNATTNELGLVWSGPVDAGSGPSAATHGSAMDCLVAAIAVA